MTPYVVDASVAVKWFLPEIHSDAAIKVLKSRRELLAPDLIWAEFGNVLQKKVRRNEMDSAEARQCMRDFAKFPVQTTSSRILADTAWSLMPGNAVSFYDALYLALAVGSGARLVTADRKFYDALDKNRFGLKMMWVEDL